MENQIVDWNTRTDVIVCQEENRFAICAEATAEQTLIIIFCVECERILSPHLFFT